MGQPLIGQEQSLDGLLFLAQRLVLLVSLLVGLLGDP